MTRPTGGPADPLVVLVDRIAAEVDRLGCPRAGVAPEVAPIPSRDQLGVTLLGAPGSGRRSLRTALGTHLTSVDLRIRIAPIERSGGATAAPDADLLVFVFDGRRPPCARYLDAMEAALGHHPVVLAVATRGECQGAEQVIVHTRRLFAAGSGLRTIPVFPVAPLVDRLASGEPDEFLRERLIEAAGVGTLAAELVSLTRSRTADLRRANLARRAATAGREAAHHLRRSRLGLGPDWSQARARRRMDDLTRYLGELDDWRIRLRRDLMPELAAAAVSRFDDSVLDLLAEYHERVANSDRDALAGLEPRLLVELETAWHAAFAEVLTASSEILSRLLAPVTVAGAGAGPGAPQIGRWPPPAGIRSAFGQALQRAVHEVPEEVRWLAATFRASLAVASGDVLTIISLLIDSALTAFPLVRRRIGDDAHRRDQLAQRAGLAVKAVRSEFSTWVEAFTTNVLGEIDYYAPLVTAWSRGELDRWTAPVDGTRHILSLVDQADEFVDAALGRLPRS